MISCRGNGPNRKSSIGRDIDTKKQEQGFNVTFEIWWMNSIKKQQNGFAKLQYYIPTQIWDSEDGF
jgi:hypothetical protein